MDRQIIYPGAIPLETDLLNTNRNVLIALGMLAQDILGTTTVVSGLSCAPNSPAAMNVVVAPGRIYSQQNVDNTAYSSLPINTAVQILKQGISTTSQTLACAAPTTAGYSINYLIEASYADVDTNPVVLPYYNSANPSQAYSGPAGAGTSQNTIRQGQVVLTAKPGIAATTGTQTTPAPDAGNVGLWVITVAYGQTSITAGSIAQYSGAPFLTTVLSAMAPLASPAFTGTPTAPTPTGTDNSTKLATTAFVQTLLGLSTSLATNGYIKIGGIIIQWGSFTGSTSGGTVINFPVAFPTACRALAGIDISSVGAAGRFTCTAVNTTSFTGAIYNGSAYVADGVMWLAIGN